MISRQRQFLFNRPVTVARILSLLLLASIGWCTTAEFTHHHGTQASTRFGTLSNAQGQAASSNQTIPARAEITEEQRSSSDGKSTADCLICQLHQNLASTLFNSPPKVIAAEVSVLNKPDRIVFQPSEFAANQHGRAPPVNL